MTSVATVTVSVVDVNDNPPEFERTMYSLSVSEATPVGTGVGRVYATSRDVGINADISYAIVDSVTSDFDVNPRTGNCSSYMIEIFEALCHEEYNKFCYVLIGSIGRQQMRKISRCNQLTRVNQVNLASSEGR